MVSITLKSLTQRTDDGGREGRENAVFAVLPAAVREQGVNLKGAEPTTPEELS